MRLGFDRPHEPEILDNVEPPLPHLGLGNIGLRFAKAARHLLLAQAARLALRAHPGDKVAVQRGMSGFQVGGRKTTVT